MQVRMNPDGTTEDRSEPMKNDFCTEPMKFRNSGCLGHENGRLFYGGSDTRDPIQHAWAKAHPGINPHLTLSVDDPTEALTRYPKLKEAALALIEAGRRCDQREIETGISRLARILGVPDPGDRCPCCDTKPETVTVSIEWDSAECSDTPSGGQKRYTSKVLLGEYDRHADEFVKKHLSDNLYRTYHVGPLPHDPESDMETCSENPSGGQKRFTAKCLNLQRSAICWRADSDKTVGSVDEFIDSLTDDERANLYRSTHVGPLPPDPESDEGMVRALEAFRYLVAQAALDGVTIHGNGFAPTEMDDTCYIVDTARELLDDLHSRAAERAKPKLTVGEAWEREKASPHNRERRIPESWVKNQSGLFRYALDLWRAAPTLRIDARNVLDEFVAQHANESLEVE